MIAVVALILAGVFAPQTGAEAKADKPSVHVLDDVSIWLLRVASWAPAGAAEQPEAYPQATQPAQSFQPRASVGTPLAEMMLHPAPYSISRSSPASFPVLWYTR
jgi:hypothetical protein